MYKADQVQVRRKTLKDYQYILIFDYIKAFLTDGSVDSLALVITSFTSRAVYNLFIWARLPGQSTKRSHPVHNQKALKLPISV